MDNKNVQKDGIAIHVASLRAEDPAEVHVAVRCLGKLGNPMAIKPLGELLAVTESQNTRNLVVKALARIGDRAAVPILLQQYDKLQPQAVVSAFARFGLFNEVIPKGNDLLSMRKRRHLRVAIRIAAPRLKELVEKNTLSAEDIERVLPPIM